MKFVVASDLHGSEYYTRAVLDALEREHGDRLLLLGDLYYHGPRNPLPKDYNPMAVAELLNGVKDRLLAVKGNCDSEVDQTVSRFFLAPHAQIFADGLTFTMTHGHLFHIDAIPAGVGDVLLYGHYHVGKIERKDGLVIANPGSASLPKDGLHGYLTIEDGTITLKELETMRSVKREKIRS